MSGFEHLWLRISAIALVIALLLLTRAPRLRRFEPYAYAGAGLIGLAAFFNFGVYLYGQDFRLVDRWEQFHYQLGSKYFPELGYDGLYAASAHAQRSAHPELPLPPLVRDLRSFGLRPPDRLTPTMAEVRARFDDARWREFVADHEDYVSSTVPAFWQQIYRDHGYNASPAWTAIARLFTAHTRASSTSLLLLAGIDVLLLVLMTAMVFSTFGWRTGCLMLAVLGLGYGWRANFVGTLLRLDWLAALVSGVCLIERRRMGAAGVCFGYAAMARVFPVLLLGGPLILALRALREDGWPVWATRFGAGLAAAVLVLLLAGAGTGRGFGGWLEFAGQMRTYQGWSATSLGLESLFVSAPGFLAERPTARRALRDIEDSRAARRVPYAAAAAGMLALAGLAVWRERRAASVVLGLAGVFALTAPPAYYWIMLAMVPLRGGLTATLGLLLVEGGVHIVGVLLPGYAEVPRRFGLLAWAYTAFFFAWLLPAAVRTLLRAPLEAGPSSGPSASR